LIFIVIKNMPEDVRSKIGKKYLIVCHRPFSKLRTHCKSNAGIFIDFPFPSPFVIKFCVSPTRIFVPIKYLLSYVKINYNIYACIFTKNPTGRVKKLFLQVKLVLKQLIFEMFRKVHAKIYLRNFSPRIRLRGS
jgi:hypothetical protein